LWLGFSHDLAAAVVPLKPNPVPWSLAHARFGSVTAYALTILLVGWVASRWYSPGAGICSSLALLVMPRAFAHAHLAALETITNLTWTIAALAVAAWWTGDKPPSRRIALFSGFLWGLAMLTKIQGVLLMVPVGLWGLTYWRHRAIVPGMLFGVAGALTLFLFWPWLWINPSEHLQEYLGRTTNRSINKVYYLGETYIDHADPDVPELAGYPVIPWHFPLVMFAVTTPLGILIFGLIGLTGRHDGKRWDGPLQVVFACLLFPIALFSLPGVAVYDGVRLFLVSLPLWAIVAGRGAALAWNWLADKAGWFGQFIWLTVFLAMPAVSMYALQPCQLSYYNMGVGSLRGAAGLGFEPTYWGDSIHRDFQKEVVAAIPAGSRVGVVPVLHQFQISDLESQSHIFRDHGLSLVPYDPTMSDPPPYVLTFYRKADHSQQLTDVLDQSELVVSYAPQGVKLAALYRLKQ
ncbi:MAG: glycosyltransferase family 39 protein, partial [Planctomycetes bacterium]|nr:glycosyltransferase family 39 protein [Planctomycetota bacterium]